MNEVKDNKLFVVVDTSEMVSYMRCLSTNKHSAIEMIMLYIFSGYATIVYSDDILDEYDMVLKRAVHGFDMQAVDDLIEFIKEIGIHFEPIKSTDQVPDENDRMFIDVIRQSPYKPIYVVTWNHKHFTPIKEQEMEGGQFLQIIRDTYHTRIPEDLTLEERENQK